MNEGTTRDFMVRMATRNFDGSEDIMNYLCEGKYVQQLKSGFTGQRFAFGGWDIKGINNRGWILTDEDLNVIEKNTEGHLWLSVKKM